MVRTNEEGMAAFVPRAKNVATILQAWVSQCHSCNIWGLFQMYVWYILILNRWFLTMIIHFQCDFWGGFWKIWDIHTCLYGVFPSRDLFPRFADQIPISQHHPSNFWDTQEFKLSVPLSGIWWRHQSISQKTLSGFLKSFRWLDGSGFGLRYPKVQWGLDDYHGISISKG